MGDFGTDINIQTLIGLFVTAFSLLLVLLGYLLRRFAFLDGRSFYFSEPLGKMLMIVGGLLGGTSFLLVLYIRLSY